MEEQFVGALDKAIEQLVREFQRDPIRYWGERDIHWNLFRYLKQQEVFQQDYITELIRAEFPTRNDKYSEEGGRSARGHYDLVVLEPDSAAAAHEKELSASWGDYLPLVKVVVAIEVKMWLVRWSKFQQRLEWDIQKLTDQQNAVKYPYLLNFVQLNFCRPQMKKYYLELREYLVEQVKQYPKLKILCVPSDADIQLQSDNWISTSQ